MRLLASGGVGRLVYNSRYGPTALPTVYKVDGESAVLGTWDPALFAETATLDAASDPHPTDYPYGELGVEQRTRTLPAGH